MRGQMSQRFGACGGHIGGEVRVFCPKPVDIALVDQRFFTGQLHIAGRGKSTQKRRPPARRTENAGSHDIILVVWGTNAKRYGDGFAILL